MNRKHYLSAIVSVVIFSLLISPVKALINVEWTVDRVYGEGSQAVMIGKVAEVVPEKQLAVITMTELLKGGTKPFAKALVLLPVPANFIKQVRPEQPAVFFLTANVKGSALLHIGDTWLKLTKNAENSDVWRSIDVDEKLTKGFPGRTSALVKWASEKNAGNTDIIMDVFAKVPFGTGQRKLAKIDVQKPTWMIAEDFNGDKKPDLIVGTAGGTKVFLAAGDAYQDATAQWGALGAGAYHAAGDVNGDGKIDLLLDGALWLNDGQKFTAAKVTFGIPAKPLAAALIDANGDQKLDAVFLSATGQVQIFENSGGTEKPWAGKAGTPLWTGGDAPIFGAIGDYGDTGKLHALVVSTGGVTRYAFDADGGASADFGRLTGYDLKKVEKFADGLKNPVAVSLSMNGGGRPDLYLFSDGKPLLLLNRGLGTFFMDDFTTHGAPKPLAYTPTPTTVMSRANLRGKTTDDVLMLAEDGTLYVMENVH